MSKRIMFNVSDEVYEHLTTVLNTEDTTVSKAFKRFAYSIAEKPMDLNAEEKRRLDAIEEGKVKLAERERKIKGDRTLPSNPFKDKVSVEKKLPLENSKGNNENTRKGKSPFMK